MTICGFTADAINLLTLRIAVRIGLGEDFIRDCCRNFFGYNLPTPTLMHADE